MLEMLNEKQITGIKCELECALKFIEYGFIVSIPYGNVSRYDLIVDAGNNKYFRIQCKNAHQIKNGSYRINTVTKQSTTSARHIKYYTNKQIDFICSVIENKLVVIPVDFVANSKSKIFRSHNFPPLNNSCNSTCNWIEDYTIEKQIFKFL